MKQVSRGRLWLLAVVPFLLSVPAHAQSSFARGTHLEWPSVLTGAFIGFMMLPAAYNAAFFLILRERFLLWEVARVLTLAGLTITLSSLPLGPWLDADSLARQVLINLLFDGSIALSGPFLRALLEPGTISQPIYRLLGWIPWPIAITTPAMLLHSCPPLYMGLRDLVLVSVFVLFCLSLAQALARGSRTARYQAAAWISVLTVYGISLYHDIILGRPFAQFLYCLFAALTLEMLFTSVGIGDRFMRLKRQRDEARAQAAFLETIAHTDPLTGLGNRRSLAARFTQRPPRAVAIIDIDHFKQINDRFGHDTGDQVIVAVAGTLLEGESFAARIGGEEFALLIYADPPFDALERLRQQIPHRVARQVPDLDHPVTASAGMAVLTDHMSFAAAMKEADLRLYEAKFRGRNRSEGPVEAGATRLAPTGT